MRLPATLSLRDRINLGFGLVIILVISSVVIGYRFGSATLSGIDVLDRGLAHAGDIQAFDTDVQTIRVNVAGWIAKPDPATKNKVDALLARLDSRLAAGQAGAMGPEEAAAYVQLRGDLAQYKARWLDQVRLTAGYTDFSSHRLQVESTNLIQELNNFLSDRLTRVQGPSATAGSAGAGNDPSVEADFGLANLNVENTNVMNMVSLELQTRDLSGIVVARSRLAALRAQVDQLTGTIPAGDDHDSMTAFGEDLKNFGIDFQTAAGMMTALAKNYDAFSKQGDVLDRRVGQLVAGATRRADGFKADLLQTVTNSQHGQIGGGALEIFVSCLFAYLTVRSIVGPLRAMTQAMGRLAEGDLTQQVPGRDRRDEIGAMASAVEVFKRNAEEVARLEGEQARQAERLEIDRRRALAELARNLESSVRTVVTEVSAASSHLQQSAASMSQVAEINSRQSTAVAGAAGQASANVRMVAEAATELLESSRQIDSQIRQSAALGDRAAAQAQRTGQVVDQLVRNVDGIGGTALSVPSDNGPVESAWGNTMTFIGDIQGIAVPPGFEGFRQGGTAIPWMSPMNVMVLPQALSTGPLSDGTLNAVPPMPVANGESAGIEAAPAGVPSPKSPLSPVETFTAIPFAAALRMMLLNARAVAGPYPASG